MKGTSLHKPLAVVGMACLLPGADGLDAFWQLLSEGRDAVVEMPPERLDRALYLTSARVNAARRTRPWAVWYRSGLLKAVTRASMSAIGSSPTW